jgi:hypothetical protein
MDNQYLCKVCKGVLNPKISIILAVQKVNSSLRGLVLLNPELGNYTKTTHSTFEIKEGEEYVYSCPMCGAQINSKKYPHLVRLVMVDSDKKESNIYFSGIAGEKCTFKIRGTKLEMIKGEDAARYSKYFEVPEEDRKYL